MPTEKSQNSQKKPKKDQPKDKPSWEAKVTTPTLLCDSSKTKQDKDGFQDPNALNVQAASKKRGVKRNATSVRSFSSTSKCKSQKKSIGDIPQS